MTRASSVLAWLAIAGCSAGTMLAPSPVDGAIDAAIDAPRAIDAAPDACVAPAPEPCGGSAHAEQEYATVVTPYDGSPQIASGSLPANTGVDWYTYTASDALFETVDPRVAVSADAELEVCIYVYCSIACPIGTTPAVAPGGQPGCCATGIDPGFQMVGCSDDDYNEVFMSVQSIAPAPACNACVAYELSYNT